MANRDIVVIGASAGGLEPLSRVIQDLPEDLPATLLVVMHVPAEHSVLPRILDRLGGITCRYPSDGEPLKPGVALVAPGDRHLVIDGDSVQLARGPRENGHRPSVDVLFRSAARSLGPRVISVVLSGARDDGAAGSVAVAMRGGLTMAQDPEEAAFPSMPRRAIEAAGIKEVWRADQLAEAIVARVGEEVPGPVSSEETLMDIEVDIAELDKSKLDDPDRPGSPSALVCPDCGGTLFELEEGGLTRFRCRVGHAWSPTSLFEEQSDGIEAALWVAARALQERAELAEQLAERFEKSGHSGSAEHFRERAEEAIGSSRHVMKLIESVIASDRSGELDDADQEGTAS